MANAARNNLESYLPDDLKNAAVSSGNELVLPYAEALAAIKIATEHQIAILGLEAFEVQSRGLLTVDLIDFSGTIRFTGDWEASVATMNAEAEHWLTQHRFGENHGYILTSTSANDFARLK